MENFYRGNTREYRFEFNKPNSLYTGRAPDAVISIAGRGDFNPHCANPIDVTHTGVISDEWTITFTSSDEFYAESPEAGDVGVGCIDEDYAPRNPRTGTPYFTISKDSWVRDSATVTGFATGDNVIFSTIARLIPEDITGYSMTLTFIVEGADAAAVTVESTAGDNPADDPTAGVMVLTLHSGESAKLVEEQYIYGFERRIPDPGGDAALDNVKTLEVGTVTILTPARPAA